jgi:hypothetical protein
VKGRLERGYEAVDPAEGIGLVDLLGTRLEAVERETELNRNINTIYLRYI